MSTPLREAAARRLRTFDSSAPNGSVRRLSVDVEVDGRVETVLVSLREDVLRCVCSDGREEGRHVEAVLRFVAGLEAPDEALAPTISLGPTGKLEAPAPNELAEALEDLLTAVVRVGVRGARYAPSVEDSLERVTACAPRPTPSGLGRFVGRFQTALEAEDTRAIARLLDGATRLVEALRTSAPTRDSERRIEEWLGSGAGRKSNVDLLYDRTMVEVGREWLSGLERATVERRYLIDVRTGITYREDRPRNAIASLGPCLRELRVGLAEIENGPSPRRIRVLQYEVRPEVSRETWQRLQQVARRSFPEMTEAYRRSVAEAPALAEPFVLIEPYRIETNGVFKAFDRDGHQLVLDRTGRRGAALAFYELLAEGMEPAWVAGRLTHTGGTLCLTPFSLATRDSEYLRL